MVISKLRINLAYKTFFNMNFILTLVQHVHVRASFVTIVLLCAM